MEITNAERKKLKAEGNSLTAAVQVGKAGVTENLLDELRRHFKKNRLVKVKMLPSATEGGVGDDDVAADLADRMGAILVEQRGHTVLLWKPRKK